MTEFTFDDIAELARTEKYSTDLQQIKLDDLKKIREYFDGKRSMLAKQIKNTEFYDKSKKEKLRFEIENARRALKDFYERREKKIISRAQFAARTNFKLKDTTNMLSAEEKFYNAVLAGLASFEKDFYLQFTRHAEPAPAPAVMPEEKQQHEISSVKIILKSIKLLDNIPELIGPDLKAYGPFVTDQTASVPEDIAMLLINQGKAIELAVQATPVSEISANKTNTAEAVTNDNQTSANETAPVETQKQTF